MGFLKAIKDLFVDGYKIIGITAPVLSIGFTAAKFLEVEIDMLKNLSYAWALLPLLIWVLIAYFHRRSLHEAQFAEQARRIRQLEDEIKKISITEETYAGVPTYHNTGRVTERVMIPFHRGIRSLEVEPLGAGIIKVVIDSPNNAVANAWFEEERSTQGVQYQQIRVGDPLHKRKWFFTTEIHRIDIIGDATIDDVEITAG